MLFKSNIINFFIIYHNIFIIITMKKDIEISNLIIDKRQNNFYEFVTTWNFNLFNHPITIVFFQKRTKRKGQENKVYVNEYLKICDNKYV